MLATKDPAELVKCIHSKAMKCGISIGYLLSAAGISKRPFYGWLEGAYHYNMKPTTFQKLVALEAYLNEVTKAQSELLTKEVSLEA